MHVIPDVSGDVVELPRAQYAVSCRGVEYIL